MYADRLRGGDRLTQSQEESATLKSRLDHSETQAQKFQVENRSLRARLESAADSGATESERLAEVSSRAMRPLVRTERRVVCDGRCNSRTQS